MAFREIIVRGTPRERGLSHGSQLAERIRQTIDFYGRIFSIQPPELLTQADKYRPIIRQFSADYADEIDAIAEAADVDPRWIYALNARTELLALGDPPANECTALYFRPTSILGQNWDWGEPMESLIVLMRIERPDGHSICMIAEPGIIGKIGMNSSGLGTCLNLLRYREQLGTGLPVHILLRAFLDCRTLEDTKQMAIESAGGKASNIVVGDDQGGCFCVEFAGSQCLFDEAANTPVLRHTNHYLVQTDGDDPDTDLASSRCRLDVADRRISALDHFTIDEMAAILSDRSDPELPIFRPYVPDEMVKRIGTVCTVIMDLPNRQLRIRQGNDGEARFRSYSVA